jgi:transposase
MAKILAKGVFSKLATDDLLQVHLSHPFSGTVFVFRSKRTDRVKMLVWDGSGLMLYWKRLEQGAFRWPPVTDGVTSEGRRI